MTDSLTGAREETLSERLRRIADYCDEGYAGWPSRVSDAKQLRRDADALSSAIEGSGEKMKRWTTHQIFVLFAPADNDEWVKWSDLQALIDKYRVPPDSTNNRLKALIRALEKK